MKGGIGLSPFALVLLVRGFSGTWRRRRRDLACKYIP